MTDQAEPEVDRGPRLSLAERAASLLDRSTGSLEPGSKKERLEVIQELRARRAGPPRAVAVGTVDTEALEIGIGRASAQPEPLMNTRAAARALGMKPSALEKWRWRGEGPPFVRVTARAIRYRRRDLEDFIRERVEGVRGGGG